MKRQICLTLRPDVIAALDREAEAEDRSRSWLADRAIDEWLSSRADASHTPQSHSTNQGIAA